MHLLVSVQSGKANHSKYLERIILNRVLEGWGLLKAGEQSSGKLPVAFGKPVGAAVRES